MNSVISVLDVYMIIWLCKMQDVSLGGPENIL